MQRTWLRVVAQGSLRTPCLANACINPRRHPFPAPLYVRPFSAALRVRKDAHQRPNPGLSDTERHVPDINYEQLKPLTESPTGEVLLIDVREPTEVIQGSIPSSVNLPMSELQDALDLDGPLFQKKFSFDKPKKTQDIVFYCLAGVRAATAAREFQSRGYQRVRNYKGSWQDWQKRESRPNEGSEED